MYDLSSCIVPVNESNTDSTHSVIHYSSGKQYETPYLWCL